MNSNNDIMMISLTPCLGFWVLLNCLILPLLKRKESSCWTNMITFIRVLGTLIKSLQFDLVLLNVWFWCHMMIDKVRHVLLDIGNTRRERERDKPIWKKQRKTLFLVNRKGNIKAYFYFKFHTHKCLDFLCKVTKGSFLQGFGIYCS
jgi:hypothetical protein